MYWNAPFKTKERQFYNDWMVHGEKSFTKGNNMRAPTIDDYLQWVVDAWEQLPKQLIVDSFKGCGLTTALDGSEDDEIHCFKSHRPIPTGVELLQHTRTESVLDKLVQQIEIEEKQDETGYDTDASVISLI